LFRVKAKYLNKYTDYSDESELVWACSAPSGMVKPTIQAVSRNEFTVRWTQP
jgi:hypothetical protein